MPKSIVPAPAFAKAITYNRETRDFDLFLDGQFVGTARSFYEGEEKLDALVYDQLQTLRVDLTDEAAAADEAADEAAAQAMDAALDLTCYCELCGNAVLPEDAAPVGEQMACEDCATREGATEPAPANVGEAVAGVGSVDVQTQAVARFVARATAHIAELGAAPSLVDVFTMPDQAWSAAIARYAPTPRRSFIAHELPAFVEELRGLLAYLPDGSVWQSANGAIRLVQAPTAYAAALAAAREVK